MNHPNLNELATRIHAQNKAAGWWDKPRPRVQTAWLVVTELAEATEAERAGKYADLKAFEQTLRDNDKLAAAYVESSDQTTLGEANLRMWTGAFKMHIKDTFEDEIADAAIRILDMAGREGVTIPNLIQCTPGITEVAFFRISEEMMYFPAFVVNNIARAGGTASEALSILLGIAVTHGFDLWHHIELKLKYNATRGKMHGGKKF